MKLTSWASLGTIVLLLVGCAVASTSPSTLASTIVPSPTARAPSHPGATPSPTSSATPSPTPIDGEELATAFLAVLDASNRVVCEANRAFESSNLEDWKAAARAIADAIRERADAVRALAFPPDLQDLKQDYIRASATFEQAIRAQSASSTVQEWISHDDKVFEANSESASIANLLRGELGLPSTPSSCEELGY